MIKILKIFLIFSSALILASSCNKDVIGEDKGVTFNYSVYYPSTKALGDGETANYVWYAQYRPDGSLVKVYEPVRLMSSGAQCPVIMMRGQSYKIVFVAQYFQEDGENLIPTYPIDPATATMSMPLTAIANSDNFDVFCAIDEVVNYNGAKAKSLEISRKTAFVNFICNSEDWTNAQTLNMSPTHSSMKFEGVSESYNLLDQTFSANTVTVEYMKEILTGEENNLGSAFCLVGEANLKATLSLYKNDELTSTIVVPTLPVKMNHRTNVTGMMMTGALDYSVTIKADPDGTHNENI